MLPGVGAPYPFASFPVFGWVPGAEIPTLFAGFPAFGWVPGAEIPTLFAFSGTLAGYRALAHPTLLPGFTPSGGRPAHSSRLFAKNIDKMRILWYTQKKKLNSVLFITRE